MTTRQRQRSASRMSIPTIRGALVLADDADAALGELARREAIG